MLGRLITRCRWSGPLALSLLVPFASAIAQQTQTVVHGADSLFTSRTVKLAWLVHRGATEDATEVVIRAVDSGWNYRWVRLDGVDPFSKSRKVLVATRPFERQTDLVVLRTAFAEYPRAEIHLFRNADDLAADRPDLTVFYLGVPDTTPEFVTPSEAEAYLTRILDQN